MKSKTISIRKALSTGWNNLEDNFKIFAGSMAIIAVVGVISFFLNIGSSMFRTFNSDLSLGFNIIVAMFTFIILIGLNIISMMLYYGVKKIAIKVYDGEEIEISDIFLNYQIILKLILFHFILAIVAFLSFLIVGIFVALLATVLGMAFESPVLIGVLVVVVLSLTIYVIMRLFFITYFIIDDNVKLMQAVKYSLRITDGVVGKLFLLNIILVVINLIGMIFGLILGSIFVTQPFSISTMAGIYNRLAEEEQIKNENRELKISTEQEEIIEEKKSSDRDSEKTTDAINKLKNETRRED